MADVPGMYEVLLEMLQDSMSDVRVSFPGKIQKVSSDGKRVDVVPLTRKPLRIDDEYGGGWKYEDEPVLAQIPLMQLVSGPWRVTVPASVGQYVTVVVSDFDISSFLNRGDVGDPAFNVSHALDGAMAVPWSFQPTGSISTTDIEIGHQDCLVKMNGTRASIGGETDAAALDSKLQIELAKIQATLLTGTSVSGGAVSFGTPYTRAATASQKLKLGG